MKALTLTQPWAGLVASGIKLIENRARHMIKREDFGKPFAIHAGRVVDREVWRIIEIDPTVALDHPGPMARAARIHRLAAITSAVIAVATIDRVVRSSGPDNCPLESDGSAATDLGDQARWFFGPIGYVLRDVRVLEKPVPCRGWQGFWTLGLLLEHQVMEQLR